MASGEDVPTESLTQTTPGCLDDMEKVPMENLSSSSISNEAITMTKESDTVNRANLAAHMKEGRSSDPMDSRSQSKRSDGFLKTCETEMSDKRQGGNKESCSEELRSSTEQKNMSDVTIPGDSSDVPESETDSLSSDLTRLTLEDDLTERGLLERGPDRTRGTRKCQNRPYTNTPPNQQRTLLPAPPKQTDPLAPPQNNLDTTAHQTVQPVATNALCLPPNLPLVAPQMYNSNAPTLVTSQVLPAPLQPAPIAYPYQMPSSDYQVQNVNGHVPTIVTSQVLQQQFPHQQQGVPGQYVVVYVLPGQPVANIIPSPAPLPLQAMIGDASISHQTCPLVGAHVSNQVQTCAPVGAHVSNKKQTCPPAAVIAGANVSNQVQTCPTGTRPPGLPDTSIVPETIPKDEPEEPKRRRSRRSTTGTKKKEAKTKTCETTPKTKKVRKNKNNSRSESDSQTLSAIDTSTLSRQPVSPSVTYDDMAELNRIKTRDESFDDALDYINDELKGYSQQGEMNTTNQNSLLDDPISDASQRSPGTSIYSSPLTSSQGSVNSYLTQSPGSVYSPLTPNPSSVNSRETVSPGSVKSRSESVLDQQTPSPNVSDGNELDYIFGNVEEALNSNSSTYETSQRSHGGQQAGGYGRLHTAGICGGGQVNASFYDIFKSFTPIQSTNNSFPILDLTD